MTDTRYCGTPIPPDGPTDLYCSQSCQTSWMQTGHAPLPIPARPEWRMGRTQTVQTPRIVDHPDGGITQIWTTDRRWWRRILGSST